MATVQVQVNDEDFMARRISPGAQLGQVQVGDTVFGSRDDVLADIKAAFIEKKVALVIRQSNSKRGTVILGCDRGGKPKNCWNLTPETRKNNKGSRLTGCKFTVSLKQYFTDDGAEMWLITKISGDHNHELPENMIGHPSARVLCSAQREEVVQLTKSGVMPSMIIDKLRQSDPSVLVTDRDVYNMRQKFRMDELQGETPISRVIQELKKNGYSYDTLVDDDGTLNSLFFIHPDLHVPT